MTQKIFAAMAGVMADMEAIGKEQKNQSQGFKYRGIDQVYNALHPLLAKHKVFTTPEVLEKAREERTNKNGTVLAFVSLRMKYTFWCEDGSSVSCVVEGEGMDSGDKASNKAMAIAHKYALLQTFCIPTEDMSDPDAEVHQLAPMPSYISRDQLNRLEAALNACSPAVQKKFEADYPDATKMTTDVYDSIVSSLESAAKKYQERQNAA